MADALALTVDAYISWTFTEALDLSNVVDSATMQHEKAFTTGTGNGQADRLFHESHTLGAANRDYNLDALAYNSMFQSNTVTIAIIKLKGIFIRRTDTERAVTLRVDSSVTNSILTPFNSDTSTVLEIKSESMVMLTNTMPGWTVTPGSADILRLTSSGAGCVYDIVLFGASA